MQYYPSDTEMLSAVTEWFVISQGLDIHVAAAYANMSALAGELENAYTEAKNEG